MRNVRSGSIQSAVREAITAAGGLECASNDVGVSVTTLSRATDFDEDRPGGLGVNHLHRLGRIVPKSAAPLAQHFARLAGGVFQEVDISGALSADMSSLTLEFSDVLRAHADAMSDRSKLPNDYTPQEAQQALVEIEELISVAVAIRTSLAEKAGR